VFVGDVGEVGLGTTAALVAGGNAGKAGGVGTNGEGVGHPQDIIFISFCG